MRAAVALMICWAVCATAVTFTPQQSLGPQVSITWDASYPDPAAVIPLNNILFAKNVTGLDPEQVHITYVSPTEVVISWATGDAVSYAAPVQSYQGADGIASEVYYGTASDSYTHNASGYTVTYSQVYTFSNPAGWPAINYTSSLLHHVPITGLTPLTKYYYTVGDPALGLSNEYSFTTAPSAAKPYPFVLGVIADLGSTLNSTATVQHMMAGNPQVFTLIGDLSYSDNSAANGTSSTDSYDPEPAPIGTYQPRWDGWYRWLEPLMSSVPFIPQHGNHELEPQGADVYGTGYGLNPNASFPGGTQFTSYVARNPTSVAAKASGSSSPLWYSVNAGPAHMVYLSNYDHFQEGSAQYEWLVTDLASYNRTAYPWLIATFHAPWYCSYTSHYAENQCMREAMEEILYDAGADIVLNGHVHAYERSYPVNNFTVDGCGITHIVLGDGGNIEGLSKTYAINGNKTTCPQAGKVAAYQPGGYCPEASFPVEYGGNFCPSGQPSWSAYRQPMFGHGIFTFLNSTHCHYTWNRNVNATSIIADDIYITRDLTCPNRAESAGAPTPATSAATAA